MSLTARLEVAMTARLVEVGRAEVCSRAARRQQPPRGVRRAARAAVRQMLSSPLLRRVHANYSPTLGRSAAPGSSTPTPRSPRTRNASSRSFAGDADLAAGDKAHRATLRPAQASPLAQLCLVRDIKARQEHLPRVPAPRRAGSREAAHRRVCFEHADLVDVRGGGARRPRHHRLATTTPSRCGATARASAPSRRTHPGSTRWRCCRAEHSSSASRTTAGRSCGRSTARSSAPSWWGDFVTCVAALPDGVHFVVGLGGDRGRPFRRGPAVPRRRDARPHLRGAHRLRERGGGDARRPAHHQRLVGQTRQGVERRQQEPREHLPPGTPTAFTRWRRCPTASASSAARRTT